MHDAFVTHAEGILTEPAPLAVLGIDETRRGRGRWTRNGAAGGWIRLERFETNFVDLAGAGGLLGQTAGQTGVVTSWLDARREAWQAAVQVLTMDPHAGYRAPVAEALLGARVVVDHFHLVQLANAMATDVRAESPASGSVAAGVGWVPPRRTGGCCCAPATGSRRRPGRGWPRCCAATIQQRDRRRLGDQGAAATAARRHRPVPHLRAATPLPRGGAARRPARGHPAGPDRDAWVAGDPRLPADPDR